MNIPNCQVAVVGGGPAGLAAAIRLTELGVHDVVVLEREPSAGGVPRHCGHPPFGLREFQRCYTGPRYATRLVSQANNAGVRIVTGVTVVALHEGGRLTLSSNTGAGELDAARVILCTGVRETPRSARLVSGDRPAGILTTGALQSMVYLQRRLPCHRPLIVGTELVSFSALLTCRHVGIKPVAMLESNHRITARRGSILLPRLLGVPVYPGTEIEDIEGEQQVERVAVRVSKGERRWIDCDGVVFSGQFLPEASLCRMGHLEMDAGTNGPRVDQSGRCSDPAYYAAGNLLRAVETAGWCWREGRRIGNTVATSLRDRPEAGTVRKPVKIESDAIRFVVPGVIAIPTTRAAAIRFDPLQIRLAEAAAGTLELRYGKQLLARRRINTVPERRILLPVPAFSLPGPDAVDRQPIPFALTLTRP